MGNLARDAERIGLECVDQLYRDWGGHYLLVTYTGDRCEVGRALSYDEALTYRPGPHEALELRWNNASLQELRGDIRSDGDGAIPPGGAAIGILQRALLPLGSEQAQLCTAQS